MTTATTKNIITPYLYQDRAVIFLDVLGFQEKLVEFEKQAVQYNDENKLLFSEAVNDFIKTFKDVISFLGANNYNYYLFSDNICITIDYNEDPNRLINILITINDLFFKFAERGYFLRGGLDVGRFVDEKDIAVGVPLSRAYYLEQNVAMYPRIVISADYKNLLDRLEQGKLITEESIAKKNLLIKKHCEVCFLNIFFNLINNENKITILNSFKASLEKNLSENSLKEKIAIKYEWLSEEFNWFIDEYVGNLMFLDTESDPEENKKEIKQIKSLKIKYHAH